MRMILPPVRERRAIDKWLQEFFASYRPGDFRRAVVALSRFYALPTPKVLWFEYLDWGRSGGYTDEDGNIHLVHPENWKRGRKYNSERRWINTVYHEMGHYIFWADAERKADAFAYRMVRGVAATNGNHLAEARVRGSSAALRKRKRVAIRRSPRPRRRRSRSR